MAMGFCCAAAAVAAMHKARQKLKRRKLQWVWLETSVIDAPRKGWTRVLPHP
jgi:hypothetical protein